MQVIILLSRACNVFVDVYSLKLMRIYEDCGFMGLLETQELVGCIVQINLIASLGK